MSIGMSVEDVNLWYGDHQALHNITLNIPAGEVTAFIGPSGCGKSTLLRCLNRMNDRIESCRVEGAIKLGDEDIQSMDVYALRRRVGMVFQRPNPFPLSIYDNVVYGMKRQGRPSKDEMDETVERTLKVVGLWDDVLLMDEPTSALDPISTAMVEELTANIKDECTVAIVTHNMQQATRVSTHTAFFYLGELIEFAPTAQLFSAPKDKRTEDYLTGRFG